MVSPYPNSPDAPYVLGDLGVHNGEVFKRLPVGGDGNDGQPQVLTAESAATNGQGVLWDDATPLTAKGDLIVMSDIPARVPLGGAGDIIHVNPGDIGFGLSYLGIGVTGQVLVVDESLDGKLKWAGAPTEKSWAFTSPAGSSGVFYYGGFYKFATSDNDFSTPPNFGDANAAYGAHLMVVLGAATVDELTLRVTGTSITDAGARATSATEDIVIPNSTSADAYYETDKKWIGQVAISVVSGTAKTCNYGLVKYWDNNNTDFTLAGCEFNWLAGANDTGLDMAVLHHKASGWTFNAGAAPTPPTAPARMSTDYVTERQASNGENGAYKRTDLATAVAGGSSEGTIIEVTTTANKAIELGSAMIRVTT